MEAKKEFVRIMNESELIALATSVHDFPNVRIVNFYYNEENNTIYFATFVGREKISEFWKNNNVAFTTIPVRHGEREHIKDKGNVRESEKTIADLEEIFTTKMRGFKEVIEKCREELKVYEIKFNEVKLTLDSIHYEKISF